MKILIVSATKKEVFLTLKKLKRISIGATLSQYRYHQHSVDVLVTGIGMTATAFHLGKIMNKKYDLLINAGIAGSFRKSIPLGTVVNVVSDCYGDLGAEDGEKFLTLKEIGLTQVSGFRFQVSGSKIKNGISKLPVVKGITVNTVHGNNRSIKKIVKKFNPDVESMEGAAFFFACNQEKIPCLQIRAISNYVERRNKKKWKMGLAVKNLNLFLEYFLKNI